MSQFMVGATLCGLLTFYSPKLMEAVYANRLAWGHVEECAECVGFVALLEAKYLGARVWLSVDDGLSWLGPLLVIDCARAQDLERLRQRRLAGELSFALWNDLELPRRPVEGCIAFARPLLLPKEDEDTWRYTILATTGSLRPQ